MVPTPLRGSFNNLYFPRKSSMALKFSKYFVIPKHIVCVYAYKVFLYLHNINNYVQTLYILYSIALEDFIIYINVIVPYLSICKLLSALNIIFSRCIHVDT